MKQLDLRCQVRHPAGRPLADADKPSVGERLSDRIHTSTVYHQLIERTLASGYVSVDETVVKLLDPDRPHKARDAWLWTYLAPMAQAIIFQFGQTRSAEHPERISPADWQGQLQCDCYSVYAGIARRRPGVVLFGCWTHARRRAVDALKSGAGAEAVALMEEINELYAIETEAKQRGYSIQQRSYYRYAKCRPVFRRLKARFERLQHSERPTSHLGDAARYALNHWQQLVRYAKPGYGHVNIDQNPIEGNIRPTKIGAKNWLHIGHPNAGWRSAVIYSIVGTCRLLQLDPLAYLTCAAQARGGDEQNSAWLVTARLRSAASTACRWYVQHPLSNDLPASTGVYRHLRLDRLGDEALLVRHLVQLRFGGRRGAAALVVGNPRLKNHFADPIYLRR